MLVIELADDAYGLDLDAHEPKRFSTLVSSVPYENMRISMERWSSELRVTNTTYKDGKPKRESERERERARLDKHELILFSV